jgi:hypothetical protein
MFLLYTTTRKWDLYNKLAKGFHFVKRKYDSKRTLFTLPKANEAKYEKIDRPILSEGPLNSFRWLSKALSVLFAKFLPSWKEGGVFYQVFLLSPLQCAAMHCRNHKRLREFEEI